MQGVAHSTATRGRPRKGHFIDIGKKKWYRLYDRGLYVGFKCVSASGTLYYDAYNDTSTDRTRLEGSPNRVAHNNAVYISQPPEWME